MMEGDASMLGLGLGCSMVWCDVMFGRLGRVGDAHLDSTRIVRAHKTISTHSISTDSSSSLPALLLSWRRTAELDVKGRTEHVQLVKV